MQRLNGFNYAKQNVISQTARAFSTPRRGKGTQARDIGKKAREIGKEAGSMLSSIWSSCQNFIPKAIENHLDNYDSAAAARQGCMAEGVELTDAALVEGVELVLVGDGDLEGLAAVTGQFASLAPKEQSKSTLPLPDFVPRRPVPGRAWPLLSTGTSRLWYSRREPAAKPKASEAQTPLSLTMPTSLPAEVLNG
eukprot:g56931.t1